MQKKNPQCKNIMSFEFVKQVLRFYLKESFSFKITEPYHIKRNRNINFIRFWTNVSQQKTFLTKVMVA